MKEIEKGFIPQNIQDRINENLEEYNLCKADAVEEAFRELAPKHTNLWRAWYNTDYRRYFPDIYEDKYLDYDKYPLKYHENTYSELYPYILENYNLSGETQRLITDILNFVKREYQTPSKRLEVLSDLLYGIGISDEEIRSYLM